MTDDDALELVAIAFLMPAVAALLLFAISAATHFSGMEDVSYVGAITGTCVSVASLGGVFLAYVFEVDLVKWIAGS